MQSILHHIEICVEVNPWHMIPSVSMHCMDAGTSISPVLIFYIST